MTALQANQANSPVLVMADFGQGNGETVFTINGKPVAHIRRDFFNRGKFQGDFGIYGSCNNSTFENALDYVEQTITRVLASFGLSARIESMQENICI